MKKIATRIKSKSIQTTNTIYKKFPFIKRNKKIIVIPLIGLIGLSALMISNAASLSIGLEPEDGNKTIATAQLDSTASGGKFLQFGSEGHHGGGGSGCADGPNFRAINICINQTSIPAANMPPINYDFVRDMGKDTRVPVTAGHQVPATRFDCGFTHASKDDPIVYPGQNDMAHWHNFAGNAGIDENTVDPATSGASNCAGGTANRTGYWAPMLVDTNSYNATTKQFNMAEPMVMGPNCRAGINYEDCIGNFMQVYYKKGYAYRLKGDTIRWFPPGFKMIAGANAGNAPSGPPNNAYFDCVRDGNTGSTVNDLHHLGSIPATCPPGNYIMATIVFPQCGAVNLDGTPKLDSPNHRDHVAYPLNIEGQGCPSTHPIAYPEISEHFRWKVPSSGAGGLKFSSDIYAGAQPGWTFHADWMNGWKPEFSQLIIDRCYRGNNGFGYDCGNDRAAPYRFDFPGPPTWSD